MHEDEGVARQYDEREVALILRNAAALQDGSAAEGRGRMTLAEVREIAREVGIDPRHVTEAAASLEVRRSGSGGGFLGGPVRFQSGLALDRELSDAELGELIDLFRGAVGLQGKTTQGLDTVEWNGREATGGYYLSATRREGKTRLRLGTFREELAMVVVMGTTLGGVVTTVVAALTVAPNPIQAPVVLAGGMVATYAVTRGIWSRIARGWDARMRGFASLLRGSVAERPATVGVEEE